MKLARYHQSLLDSGKVESRADALSCPEEYEAPVIVKTVV